jgi:DNA-binding response OmpR family regulator
MFYKPTRGFIMRYYISIEKNIEVFNFYKNLWSEHGIIGIRAENMTEGIEKAIEIEKSPHNELYFIDIVADDIDYMAQLKILSNETTAPILIATSKYSEKEHHEAFNNGADFYGGYCKMPEQNIEGVISAINSIDRRAKKPKTSSEIIIYKNLLISPAYLELRRQKRVVCVYAHGCGYETACRRGRCVSCRVHRPLSCSRKGVGNENNTQCKGKPCTA